MTSLDDPAPLNTDALLQTIYGIQADLKILTDWLARERQPALSDAAIINLMYLHIHLQRQLPMVRRH